MFSLYHFIWLGICFVILVFGTYVLKKYQIPMKDLLTICCVLCVVSELIKTFSAIRLVPSVDGSQYYPYIEMQHLPLHLCSLQILCIFYLRFSHNERIKDILYGFMYPTCIAGAFMALALPSIFTESIKVTQAFTHPLAYQFFLYHTMLIVLGIRILQSNEVQLCKKHYFYTLGILCVLAFLSLYANSMFAHSIYENGILQHVDYTPNLFFTYQPPIDIAITELWQWYVYLGVIILLALVLITLFYLPYLVKNEKKLHA